MKRMEVKEGYKTKVSIRTAICIPNALTYGIIDHDIHIFRRRR